MPFHYFAIFGGILGALRCRQAQPHMRLDIILWAQAVGIHESEVELRQGQALVGGEAKPFDGVGIVLRSAFAIPRHDAEIELGRGVALVSGEMIPFQRLAVVLWYAVTVLVHNAEIELPFGVPLVSGKAKPL